jgi:hypothetical protein
VLQKNPGGYVSELIADRFQILSSYIGKTYFIIDLTSNDGMMRDDKGDKCDFNSVEDARAFIDSFTTIEMHDKEKKVKPKQSATARAITSTRKTAGKPPKKEKPKMSGDVPTKLSRRLSDLRSDVTPPEGATPAVTAAATDIATPPKPRGRAVKTVPTNGEIPTKQPTAASLFRKYISEGELSPSEIHETVEKLLGKKFAKNAVAHYTKDLQAKGHEGLVVPTAGVSGTRSGTAAAMFRELIQAGTMSSSEIHAAVEEAFNKKFAKNAVAHYTKDLQAKGVDVRVPA